MTRFAWRPVLLYGALLAAGTVALQWLDYVRFARTRFTDVYIFIIAAVFLGVGVGVGAYVLRPQPRPHDGNPRAQESLGISERELEVLTLLAGGYSNGEIADRLSVSNNTVKTHVARLYQKLDAKRRTDAVNRARELGILP